MSITRINNDKTYIDDVTDKKINIYFYLIRALVSVIEIAWPFNFQWCKFFYIAINRRFIPLSAMSSEGFSFLITHSAVKSSRHCTEVLMAALTVVNPFLSRPWKCRGTCYDFETYLTSFPEPV